VRTGLLRYARNDGNERRVKSTHDDVRELPRIFLVELFGEEHAAIVQRRPFRIFADDRTEIRTLHFEAAMEIHLVGFYDALKRVFERPDHAGEDSARHLKTRRILVGGDAARLFDRQLRAVPIGVLLVPVEQHAELIDASSRIFDCFC
jgi:hypothetical protein